MLPTLLSEPYWSPTVETMPRHRLEELQWTRLTRLVHQARERSPFWADRLPADLTGLEDFTRRVPIVRKQDLLNARDHGPDPLYGGVPTVDPRLGIRYHQTSGTSGNPPVRTIDTARDWALMRDSFCTALWAMGVRPGQRSMVTFGYGTFMGLWGMHDALERMGCLNIPTGGMNTKTRVRFLVEREVQVLGCTPSYARRLIEVARQEGIDLATDSHLEVVLAGAEPRTDAAVRELETSLGCRVYNAAGTTETGIASLFECDQRRGAVHTNEHLLFDEVLDPDTLEPAPYGAEGIRVSTTLTREGFPVFRHWTEDRVIRRPGSDCPCGRTWDFFDGGILGRADDLKKIRGVSVTPEMIDDILSSFRIARYRASIQAIQGLDTLVIELPEEELPTGTCEHVSDEVKAVVGLRPAVRTTPASSLPESDWKVKRFFDER